MKKSLVRIILFLSVSMLAVSCVNYNRIRLVKCGKPTKREFVDQAQTETKASVNTNDNSFQKIEEVEIEIIESNSTLIPDLVPELLVVEEGEETEATEQVEETLIAVAQEQQPKKPRNYKNKKGMRKRYRKSGRIMGAGLFSILIPVVGVLCPIFFIWASVVALKSIKKTKPTTEAGTRAEQFFDKAKSFGKSILLCFGAIIFIGIIFILIGILDSMLATVLLWIPGIIAFGFAMMALVQLIKSAKQSRIDKLTRKPGDVTGDELRRTTWFLITLGALLTLPFFPIVMGIAIGAMMSVKAEYYFE